MRPGHPHRDLAFLINDVGRMLRTYADQEVRRFGMTRAQWAVLKRLELNQGLKQSELAEMLDLQPITLTRLVDRLCDSGLIERRADPNDRRAKRLYLTPAARPLIDRIAGQVEELAETVLEGIGPDNINQMTLQFGLARENLRQAIARAGATETVKRYG